ncbi:DUF1177 domain-containing protein [Marinitenerispora sediminis]|uniref:DUF1177 domain-containing protein n=1 Tax=Marinitenerispora sediminis TaxID=1931232 RepID=A0A368TCJ2_9ACTN|nr:DUF1177 domain-containing protein [Marinitenerispora sediminis]RCV54598.1 DUF1177 domain-containing protein [Marinitenerispora sediminis]RCV59847.1 DUF1177 domain-containing protein [Marinitenerispora sediminis]RCV61174.1 DUF1177 domain-containing protein [Marinitenerispora sediminis]
MLRHVLDMIDLLDDPAVTGAAVADRLAAIGAADVKIDVTTVQGELGSTDFVRVVVPGTHGKLSGGAAPTLGIVGRLGGVGARPERIGFVSDGDGAVAALSAAEKLTVMARRGDRLAGDVIIGTHVCPDAPTEPHDPVPFMGSSVDMDQMNDHEVSPEMDAVLSIDTTKGNRIINHRGLALSPTVKEGYILRVSPDLVELLETVTGRPVVTYPVTTQDITPYGNELYHINSILQPAVATAAPVVGLAITAASAVPGCGTGASHETDIAEAARYAVEVGKAFTAGQAQFHDAAEFDRLVRLYGSMTRFQTLGADVG